MYYISIMSLEKMEPVLNEVRQMMVEDNVDESLKAGLTNLVQKSLSLNQYMNAVKGNLDAILSDKKIDTKDVPKMVLLSIQVNGMLPKILGLQKGLSIQQVKYIVYGTIYFYIVNQKDGVVFFTEDMTVELFRSFYSNVWDLVAFDPRELKNAIKSACGCLCA